MRQFPKIRGRSSAELGFFADLPALGFAGFRLKQRRQNGQSDDDAGNDQDTTIRVKRVGKTEFEPPAIENEVRVVLEALQNILCIQVLLSVLQAGVGQEWTSGLYH